MKIKYFALILCLFTEGVAFSQKLPDKKDILAKMTLTNAHFMQNWPDPGKELVHERVRPANIWTRAVYYEGLMALHAVDSQKAYYDYAVLWG